MKDPEMCMKHGRLKEMNYATGEKTCWKCVEEDFGDPLKVLTPEHKQLLFEIIKARIDKKGTDV